ncbi:MAG: hypothetical protein ISP99_03395, partial [Pseudomonadales bacterium]|nr:hypothetical protein [Pseudomonadales bacterium]
MEFTQRVEQILSKAHALASAKRNPSLEPTHIALAMSRDAQSLVAALAQSKGRNVSTLANELARMVDALPTLGKVSGDVAASPALQKTLQRAQSLAEQAADAYVSEDWIVLALFQDEQVGKVLKSTGLTEQNATEFIESQRQGRTVESKNDEETRNALEKFTQDLTALAEQGKLDP